MAIDLIELSDREEIRQVMYSFFRAGDRRDKELARANFWEDGHLESFPLDEAPSYFMPTLLSEDGGARFERLFEVTNHYMLNMVIRVQGQDAYSETYAIAYHVVPADRESIVEVAGEARFAELGNDASRRYELSVGTRYCTHFQKRNDMWKIKVHRYIVDWTKFSPYEGVSEGGVLSHLRLRGTRDRTDRSYEWLP